MIVRKLALISFPNYRFLKISLNLTTYLAKYKLKNLVKDSHLSHAHNIFPDGFIANYCYKKYGLSYIVTMRDQRKIINNKWRKRVTADILDHAYAVTVISKHHKNKLKNITSNKIHIIPHGIEKDILLKGEKKSKKEYLDIIIIAEMIELKHIDWVISAFNSLVTKKKCRLFIVGDGPLREKINNQCSGNKNIKLFGQIPREKVLQLLDNTDIFVLPSFPESFGVVFLEAMAKKNAVIGIRDSGVCGLFREGEEILIAERNVTSLKKLLNNIVNDDQLRNKLADLGYNAVKSAYCIDHISNKYKKLYDEALIN
jgi:L-malate glycosyltransferase